MFSRIAFHFHNGTDFFAGVFGVPFIEHGLFGKGKSKQAKIQYSCEFAVGWLSKC